MEAAMFDSKWIRYRVTAGQCALPSWCAQHERPNSDHINRVPACRPARPRWGE